MPLSRDGRKQKFKEKAMKIKLIRTGGFIPVTKSAETEVSFSDKELDRLLQIIQPDTLVARIKDGNYYELTVGQRSAPVDLDKVPTEYKSVFIKLKSELKIIK
jgi:hypothetical protein